MERVGYQDPIPMFAGVPFLPAPEATLVFIALLVAVVALLAVLAKLGRPLDHDPGPPPGERYPIYDRWSFWHFGASYFIALGAMTLGCPWWVALTGTMVAGLAWEIIHGYVDWTGDLLTWDLTGSLVGIGTFYLLAWAL